jgi:hypothetical protein
MDFIELTEEFQRKTGATIPDHDYPRLATFEGCVAYLSETCAADGVDASEA